MFRSWWWIYSALLPPSNNTNITTDILHTPRVAGNVQSWWPEFYSGRLLAWCVYNWVKVYSYSTPVPSGLLVCSGWVAQEDQIYNPVVEFWVGWAVLVKTEIYPGTQWLCKSFQLTGTDCVTHKSEKIEITKHTLTTSPSHLSHSHV